MWLYRNLSKSIRKILLIPNFCIVVSMLYVCFLTVMVYNENL